MRIVISRRRDFSEIMMRHLPGKGEGRRNARSLKNSSPICALPKILPLSVAERPRQLNAFGRLNRINTLLIRKRNDLSSYEFLKA